MPQKFDAQFKETLKNSQARKELQTYFQIFRYKFQNPLSQIEFQKLSSIFPVILNECYIFNDIELAEKIIQFTKFYYEILVETSEKRYLFQEIKNQCSYTDDELWEIQIKTKIKEILNLPKQHLAHSSSLEEQTANQKYSEDFIQNSQIYQNFLNYAKQMQIFSYSSEEIIVIFNKVCIALNLSEQNLITFLDNSNVFKPLLYKDPQVSQSKKKIFSELKKQENPISPETLKKFLSFPEQSNSISEKIKTSKLLQNELQNLLNKENKEQQSPSYVSFHNTKEKKERSQELESDEVCEFSSKEYEFQENITENSKCEEITHIDYFEQNNQHVEKQ